MTRSGTLVTGPGSPERKKYTAFAAGCFIASLMMLAAGWLMKGDVDMAIRPDSDDFIRAGTDFLMWMFGNGVSYAEVNAHPVFPSYLLPSVVLAGIDIAFDQSVLVTVALNSVLFSGVVALLFWFWCDVSEVSLAWGSWKGMILGTSGGLYIAFGLPDAFLLSYTVLTDIIFLFWVAVFVVAVARGLLYGHVTPWLIALFIALAALYVRPTGILLPALLLFALTVKFYAAATVPLWRVAVVSIGAALGTALLVIPWLVVAALDGRGWLDGLIPGVLEREFLQAVSFFRGGIVVSDRPETYVSTPSTYLDILQMALTRLGYYWVPLRLGSAPYSMLHNLVNLIYIVLILPLAALGLGRLAQLGRHEQAMALFLVMVSLCYALLHAVTLLSFSWRYQLPAMIPLWMLAGVGWSVVLRRRATSAWNRDLLTG